MGDHLQLAEKVEDDLIEGQEIAEQDALGADVLHLFLLAPPAFQKRQDGADVAVGGQDDGFQERLFDALDLGRRGELGGRPDFTDLPRLRGHPVADGRSRRQEGQPEFALQALLDDLAVEQAQEPAAVALAQGH